MPSPRFTNSGQTSSHIACVSRRNCAHSSRSAGERDAVEQLPRRDVAVGQPERFGDVALPLESLALHRRQLLLHQRAARRLDRRALALVGACCQLDRRALVRDLAPVVEPHHRVALPRDLALVERRQLARALRLRLPVEQQTRRASLLAPLGAGEEVSRVSSSASRPRMSRCFAYIGWSSADALSPACASKYSRESSCMNASPSRRSRSIDSPLLMPAAAP